MLTYSRYFAREKNVLRSGCLMSWSNGSRNCRARLARQWRSCSDELSRLISNARS